MAELFLQVTLDENGAVTKLNNISQTITQAGGESQGAAGQVDKLALSFNKSESIITSFIGTLSGVGLAYAALRLERMVEGWVKLDMAQAQADNSLRAVMMSTNRFSESFYQSTLKQAEALQKLTGIDDAQIERGQRMLSLYENISNDIMPRTTQAMVNLAALMEGDVHNAAVQLGKAMEGQTQSLRRVGIVIDENIFKERGAIGVLEEVEKKVNGQAEAMAQGSGQWKLLGAAVGEAKEAMGGFISQVIIDTGILTGLTNDINSLAEVIKYYRNESYSVTESRYEEEQKALTKAGEIYLEQMKAWGNQIADMPTLADQIVNPMESVTVALESSAIALDSWADRWERAKPQVSRLTDEEKKVAKALQEVNDIIAKSTFNPYNTAVYELDKIFKGLKETLGSTPEVMQAYGVAMKKLNDDLLAQRGKWQELYSEKSSERAPLTSLAGEYTTNDDLLNQLYGQGNSLDAMIASTKQTWLFFNTTLKDFNDDQQKELEENYAYFSDLQVKQAEETQKIWDDAARGLESSFISSFDNVYKNGLNAFKDLGKNGADTLIHAINQQLLAKPLESLTNNITGLFTNTTKLAINPATGLYEITGSKGALSGAAPYLSAGAAGYGVGGVGGAVGAMGGYYAGTQYLGSVGAMAGPIGMILGTGIGMAITDIFSSGTDLPSVAELQHTAFMTGFKSTITEALSQGFVDGLSSGGVQDFMNSIKSNLNNIILNSLKNAFVAEAAKPLINLFAPAIEALSEVSTGRPSPFPPDSVFTSAWNKLQGSLPPPTIEGAIALLPEKEQVDIVLDQMKPLFEKFNILVDALGLNTTATQNNTDAILGPVEAFLRDLNTGAMAPVLSAEGMQNTYNDLLADAIANPSAFSTFAGFARSDYLPFEQANGGYSDIVGQVRSDVNAIPWYSQQKSATPSAQEIGIAVAQAIAVNPHLSGEIHIKVTLNGHEIATEVVQEIENSPDLSRRFP